MLNFKKLLENILGIVLWHSISRRKGFYTQHSYRILPKVESQFLRIKREREDSFLKNVTISSQAAEIITIANILNMWNSLKKLMNFKKS